MRARGRRFPDGKLGPSALRPAFVALGVLVLACAVAYLAVAALVWVGQDRLIFYPPAPAPIPAAPPGWRLEEVSLATSGDALLSGVLVLPPVGHPPLVIYFGGNAEDVTASAASSPGTYGARAVLLVNYRGYGRSKGRPSEKALVSDAIALHDWAVRRPDIDASRVALHGRSLGTAVAVQLAEHRAPRCVVLTSPFASATDIAREAYPWLPIRWLLRHPFDSARHAARLAMPALVLFGEDDDLVAPRHSERLARAWAGPVERVSFAGFGHNDLQLAPRYAAAVRAFLDRCL